MGLFNRKKEKKQEQPPKEASGFVSFVLLGKAEYDFRKLTARLKADWGIEIDESDIDFDKGNMVSEADGMMIAVGFMEAPVPGGEAVENARTNYAWPGAVEAAEKHLAHLVVAVMARENSVGDAGWLFVKLLASAAADEGVTGINTLGSVLHPGAYRDMARLAAEEQSYPTMNLIFVGLYSNDGGKTTSAYTYGMSMFGKYDIEILGSSHSREEVYYFLYDIADYVITSDVTLRDGETIGFTPDQKLRITFSDGAALPDKTLKIDF